MKRPAYLLWLAACAGLQTSAAQEAKPEAAAGHVFAWPFMDWQEMKDDKIGADENLRHARETIGSFLNP